MKIYLLIVLTICFLYLSAQDKPRPVNISVYDNNWAFPLSKVFPSAPIAPGINIGSEFIYKEKKRSKIFQTANISGLINKGAGSAFFLNSDFAYRYTFGFGLKLDAALGLGYYHSFYARPIYKMNANNEYEKLNDPGIPGLLLSTGFGLGFDLCSRTKIPFDPFIRYQWIASTPFMDMIPIRPQSNFHLGITIYLNNKNQ